MQKAFTPSGGLQDLVDRIKTGAETAEAVCRRYLDRIESVDDKYQSYVHVDQDAAMAMAAEVDRKLAQGIDPGPLAGVPVAVKDLLAVAGMPVKAGSQADVADIIGAEGPFVKALRQSGCVILGKTRTTEFAAGAQNICHITPWNPCDEQTRRTPGGSSSGSAVAVAAGLCAFAIGSDTGGSVRVPAALCGITGFKASAGTWSLDGIFPLSAALDSLGFLTSSVSDAIVINNALSPRAQTVDQKEIHGLRFGVPRDWRDGITDNRVATDFGNAISKLSEAGAVIEYINWPDRDEQKEVIDIFATLVPSDLMEALGRARVDANADRIDPIVLNRLRGAIERTSAEYVRLSRRKTELAAESVSRMAGLDAVVSLTTPITAPVLKDLGALEPALAFISAALRNARPANVYDLCAASVPIQNSCPLPVGLQIACVHGKDSEMLGISKAVESALTPVV
jgi:aspartyl-tRNA(Asn)/glutamyl-tRNA(Gln) amidotransferase subunit A